MKHVFYSQAPILPSIRVSEIAFIVPLIQSSHGDVVLSLYRTGMIMVCVKDVESSIQRVPTSRRGEAQGFSILQFRHTVVSGMAVPCGVRRVSIRNYETAWITLDHSWEFAGCGKKQKISSRVEQKNSPCRRLGLTRAALRTPPNRSTMRIGYCDDRLCFSSS
jgi:hypothetical protein